MKRFEPYVFLRELPSRWDVLAFIVVIGLIAFLGETARGLFAPLTQLSVSPLSLNPGHLPEYAARTTFRMLAALFFSLLFTFTYATWAAKSERAGRLLVPILDILQSVPILGFISITSVFFLSLAPGRVLGAEFAAIFAIFTSQAWNMAFSFYQSLRTVPIELMEAAESFRLSPWMRFWQLEVPFGLPALVWNMMLSMSGGWFFVVASESISVGHSAVALPGVGIVHSPRHPAKEPSRHRLGDPHHVDRDSALRSAAVPSAGRLGRSLPGRTGTRRACARFMGADHDAPFAPDQGGDGGLSRRGAVDQPGGEAQRPAGARAGAAAKAQFGSVLGSRWSLSRWCSGYGTSSPGSSRTRRRARPCTSAGWRSLRCCGCSF